MKHIQEWTEADLQRLINNNVQENIKLEYKRLKALSAYKDISIDVSAFANSAGGLIIYGIEEIDQLPARIDPDTTHKPIDRETLENVITSNINPRINGVVIQPISISSGQTAYVVKIPENSRDAPHQANDKRYYRRANFKNIIMEDYEVRDAFRRARSPYIRVRPTWKQDETLRGSTKFGELKLYIENLEDEPALYTKIKLVIDKRIANAADLTSFGFRKIDEYVEKNTGLMVVSVERNLMVPTDMPLFRGSSRLLLRSKLGMIAPEQYVIGYRIASPGFLSDGMGLFRIEDWTILGENESAIDMLSVAV